MSSEAKCGGLPGGGGVGKVTEGGKVAPPLNGAAQVGGFQRGQRRDLVRLGGEELAPGRNRLRWCSRMVKPLHPGAIPFT